MAERLETLICWICRRLGIRSPPSTLPFSPRSALFESLPFPIQKNEAKHCFASFEERLSLWIQIDSEKSIAICLQYESPFVRVFCWFCGFCWFIWPCCCCMVAIFCFSLYSTWPCCKFTSQTGEQTGEYS